MNRDKTQATILTKEDLKIALLVLNKQVEELNKLQDAAQTLSVGMLAASLKESPKAKLKMQRSSFVFSRLTCACAAVSVALAEALNEAGVPLASIEMHSTLVTSGEEESEP